MNDHEETVVGAGPAGLAAAITLARAGRKVRVMERHRAVGQRFHGDMQGLENWSTAEDVLDSFRRLGIETDFAYRRFDEVTFYDSRLRPVVARTPRSLFHLVRRGPGADTLDTALLRQPREAGAEVRFGETAQVAGPGAIVATCPQQADGIAAGFVFGTPLPDQAHAIVHPRLAPAGYAYLLVWGGQATLATCLFRGSAALAAGARGHGGGVRAAGAGAAAGGGPPVRRVRRAAHAHPLRRRVGPALLRRGGGAAGRGGGFCMVTAIRSGVLAATGLIDAEGYAERAYREFDPSHAARLVNRAAFERMPQRLFDAALRREAGRQGLPGRLRRHWAPNRVKSLLAPRLLTRFEERLHQVDRACHEASCRCLRCTCGDLVTDTSEAVTP